MSHQAVSSDVQNSIETGLYWLNEAARKGLIFARALCSRLNNLLGIQIRLEDRMVARRGKDWFPNCTFEMEGA
jgi:hypothetical protein